MSRDHSGHDHGIAQAPERALRWALLLTGSFMIAEAVGGFLTNSLALLSDAAHMLTDTAALAIALVAIRIGKRAADARRTFGYARFEILAAAFNAVVLFLVALYILWEAIDRFRNPPPIQSTAMMVIAVIGLVINVISMRLLRGGSEASLNVKGAYLEVWSDMLGSVGVLVAGATIYLTGWKPIDPIIAVLIGFWVLPRTWILLRDSLNILLEGVPPGVVLQDIEDEILATPGVTGVHDLHVWAVSSGKSVLTAHVVRTELTSTDGELLEQVRARLIKRFHIHHATLQLETVACATPGCALTSSRHDEPHA
jgi:cobalt-zinc-cadmium efflux system protein